MKRASTGTMPEANAIAAYLDGHLSPSERAAFERAMAGSSELMEWVAEAQRLREDTGQLLDDSEDGQGETSTRARSRWRLGWGGVGVLIAAAIATVWFLPDGGDLAALLRVVDEVDSGQLVDLDGRVPPAMATLRGPALNSLARSSFRSGVLWATISVLERAPRPNEEPVERVAAQLALELTSVPLSGPVLRRIEISEGVGLDVVGLGRELSELLDAEWFKLGAWTGIAAIVSGAGGELPNTAIRYFQEQGEADWPEHVALGVEAVHAALMNADPAATRVSAEELILRGSN